MKALDKFKLDPFPQPEVILLKHPVMLCHGFGSLANVAGKGLLHKTCMMLREHGVLAFAPNIAPYATIKSRAEVWSKQLETLINQTGAKGLHVVAHSMGGLDMRYAVSTLGMHSKIKSLTTVSTPHQGSCLAGLTLNTPESILDGLEGITNWFGNNIYPEIKSDVIGALKQLEPDYLNREFNPSNPDHPDVYYQSVTASCGKGTSSPINKLLIPFNNYIYERQGVNDGYVPAEPAKWGHHLLHTDLSHPEQIALNIPSRRKPVWEKMWLDIIRSLQEFEKRS